MTERSALARPRLWAARAGVAERAIYTRHLRRLWLIPGTRLGLVAWPSSTAQRLHAHWNYWWQAHLLDTLVDAQLRFPTENRKRDLARLVRGIHRRNFGHWLNDFYDDISWLGLALLRAEQHAGVANPVALREIADRLRSGWTDHGGGGIWWRRGADYKNVPANGPAAILLARLSEHLVGDRVDRQRARSAVEWMEEYLVDERTGLVWDGLHVAPDGTVREVEHTVYTYCQGVFLGACLDLAQLDGPGSGGWAKTVARTIGAVSAHLTVPDQHGQVLRGQGGGDGGLFGAILARYLSLAAMRLPAMGVEFELAAHTAADLVFASAEAAWQNRAIAPGGPLFGPEWTKPAVRPGRARRPERDLSVQAGGWMLMEAAAALEREGMDARPGTPESGFKDPDSRLLK
ncbi:MAG TPA: glycoside hydrolase family 76 protein [Pseudonocardiaceae bacterium]|nr:glycoside hydrolase family 76 protein [Pseudonocardiaceae bacterium]